MSQQYGATNSYFVPGYGISRTVIQSEIRYFSGPDSIARPYTHQGRDGFLVTTSGPPLTKAQIEDLKDSSAAYERRQSGVVEEQDSFVNSPIPVGHRSRRSG